MEIFGEAILKIASQQANNHLHQRKVVVKRIVGLVLLVHNLVQVFNLWDYSSMYKLVDPNHEHWKEGSVLQ